MRMHLRSHGLRELYGLPGGASGARLHVPRDHLAARPRMFLECRLPSLPPTAPAPLPLTCHRRTTLMGPIGALADFTGSVRVIIHTITIPK